MKTILSALKVWICDELNKLSEQIKYAKSDWNQRDPNGAGYIQNRTHYDDGFFTEEQVINATAGVFGFIKLADAPLSFDITKISSFSLIANIIGEVSINVPISFYQEENGLYFTEEFPLVYCDDDDIASNALPTGEKGLYIFSMADQGDAVSLSYSFKIEDIKHLDPKYIKDMYYEKESVEKEALVENLTYNNYDNGYVPGCTFIVGDSYNVIWNDTLYENLICVQPDSWRILGNPENLPFYINDNGGNDLYIEANDDSSNWTVSIYHVNYTHELKTIDPKYLPVEAGMYLNEINIELPAQVTSGGYFFTANDKVFFFNSINHRDGAYSDDGIHWQASSIIGQNPYSWSSVVYCDDRYYTVSIGSEYSAYSYDGVNWTYGGKLPGYYGWTSLTYGKGMLLAVNGENPSIIAYSTDKGFTWETTTISGVSSVGCICYGNDRFVAISRSSALYSDDGINWNQTTLPCESRWSSNALIYADNKFVATGNSNTAMYSYDGIEWFSTTLPGNSGEWYSSLAYGNGVFVAVGYWYTQAVYSFDGITWHITDLPEKDYWTSIAYIKNKFIAMGHNNSSDDPQNNQIAFSYDGITWQNGAYQIYQQEENITKDIFNVLAGEIATKDYVSEELNNININVDWNQNDETALGYIKNRPFYEDEDGVHTIDPKFLPKNIGSKLYFEIICDDSDSDGKVISDDYYVIYERLITNKEEPEIILKRYLKDDVDRLYPIVYKCSGWFLTESIGAGSFYFSFINGSRWGKGQNYNGETITVRSSPIWTTASFVKESCNIFNGIILEDRFNNYEYVGEMHNGNFVTYCRTDHLEITTQPNLTQPIGQLFNPEGMVLSGIGQDGGMREITNYTFKNLSNLTGTLGQDYLVQGINNIQITYIEAGVVFNISVEVQGLSETEFLLTDFEYTINDDGTYTITGWKGTSNGKPSTEIVIPNNNKIKVDMEG